MNKQHAEVILAILMIAQDNFNWQDFQELMEKRGYTVPEIRSAWKALEKLAGSVGTSPV